MLIHRLNSDPIQYKIVQEMQKFGINCCCPLIDRMYELDSIDISVGVISIEINDDTITTPPYTKDLRYSGVECFARYINTTPIVRNVNKQLHQFVPNSCPYITHEASPIDLTLISIAWNNVAEYLFTDYEYPQTTSRKLMQEEIQRAITCNELEKEMRWK